MHENKYHAVFLLFILLFGKSALAIEHYVSPDGTASWNESTDIASPCGLATANDNVVAGDIVYMLGGTYTGGQIKPGRSGTAGNPIMYRSYNGQTVTISETNDPIFLPGISYIVVHGINVRNCDYYLTMHDGGHNTIELCTFLAMRFPYDRSKGFQVGPGASYNRIHNCIISGYGEYSGGQDRGDMVYVGSSNDNASHHNLIEDNHLYWGGHNIVIMDGHHNILRNNYLHNEPWAPDENGKLHGNRILAFRNSGSGEGHGYRNLVEGNRFCFSATGNDAGSNTKAIQHLNRDCIYRGNMFYHIEGAGIHIVTNGIHPGPDSDNNYIYHNNFFHTGLAPAGISLQSGLTVEGRRNGIDHVYIKNNIFYEINGTPIKVEGDVQDVTIEGNWEDAGDPFWLDARISKLNVGNQGYPDFNLQSRSQCIDNGAWLTQTTSSGNGHRITVQNADYFMDGWGMQELGVKGDMIQMEGRTQRARIMTIDYETNTITVDKNLTWNKGQGVALAYEGVKPDMGAFEYKAR